MEKHPLDLVVARLEVAADMPVATQAASPDYWGLKFATDDTVGDYPQVVRREEYNRGEAQGLGPDGFPAVRIPELELQSTALWTDVLSSVLWSDGYLLNDRALAEFKQCNLGQFREYPVVVRDHTGATRALTYLFIHNVIQPTAIDFERAEFYVANTLGIPLRPVAINSFEEWEEVQRKAMAGELDGCKRFSMVYYKKLFFRRNHLPTVDLFKFARLGTTVYISSRLRESIVNSRITGLEIKLNKRLFADH